MEQYRRGGRHNGRGMLHFSFIILLHRRQAGAGGGRLSYDLGVGGHTTRRVYDTNWTPICHISSWKLPLPSLHCPLWISRHRHIGGYVAASRDFENPHSAYGVGAGGSNLTSFEIRTASDLTYRDLNMPYLEGVFSGAPSTAMQQHIRALTAPCNLRSANPDLLCLILPHLEDDIPGAPTTSPILNVSASAVQCATHYDRPTLPACPPASPTHNWQWPNYSTSTRHITPFYFETELTSKPL
jgi:hypothetical protein